MKLQLSKLFRCNNLYQYLATLSGSFAVLVPGINLGWTSPYLPQILNGDYPEFAMTSDQGSWCAVMSILGAPLGAFVTVIAVDRIGRKNVVLLMAPVTFFLFILLAFSNTVHLIFLARFGIGIIDGGLYTALPMYLSEIANPSIRGILTSSVGTAAIIGTLLINIIGFHCTIYVSSLLCSIIPVIHFLTFIWMPESPYYYIKKGKIEEANKSLQTLRGSSDVDEEIKALISAVSRQEENQKGRFVDLFLIKSNRRAVFLFVIISLTKKFSGKSPFLYYTTTIFQQTQDNLDPKISVIIYISVEVLATILALILIDRTGRRPLIIVATIGCALGLAVTGGYFFCKYQNNPIVDSLGWLPLTALTVYIICFSLGLELTPTVYLGELFPMNVKAAAHGLGDTFAVITGVITTKLFQYLTDNVDIFVPFWIFSSCCVLGFIFIVKYIPETKNKTLEEIQLYLISKTTKVQSQ